MDYYEIDLKKLQSIVDIMASLIKVPAGLIMRLDGEQIEVFVSSKTSGNPYKMGDKEHLINSGLYCETVIKSNSMLVVPNALNDPDWRNNPDVKLKMISYLGLPINLPSGKPFGTICVLDNKENHYCSEYVKLLTQFRDLVEDHFRIVENKIYLTRAETFKASIRTMMNIVNNTLNSLVYFQIKMERSEKFTENDIALYKNLLKNCSAELCKMEATDQVDICRGSLGDIIKY
jgi:GAF domain-containing protein